MTERKQQQGAGLRRPLTESSSPKANERVDRIPDRYVREFLRDFESDFRRRVKQRKAKQTDQHA
jgi:hypothetical protein